MKELEKGDLIVIDGGDLLSTITNLAKGGVWWAIYGLYLIEETLASPMASYNAFMKGWNTQF